MNSTALKSSLFSKFQGSQLSDLNTVQGGRERTTGGTYIAADKNGDLQKYTYEKDVIRNNGTLVRKRISQI